MLSYIFDSEKSFFSKIIITFTSIFICSNLFLLLIIKLSENKPFSFPVLDHFNEIALERFALKPEKWKVVVVGSSAVSYIPPYGYWPEGCYNLGQQGSSASTGLEAILRSGAHPQKIFIESDFLMRVSNKEILDHTFSKINFFLKRDFPIFQEEYSPLVYLQSVFYPIIIYDVKPGDNDVWNKRMGEIGNRAKKYLTNQSLSEQIIKKRIMEIRKLTDTLRKNGSEIVFFTLPLHPILNTDSIYQKWNTSIRNELNDYKWVSFRPENFLTEDGIHPTVEAGYRMFQMLMKQ